VVSAESHHAQPKPVLEASPTLPQFGWAT